MFFLKELKLLLLFHAGFSTGEDKEFKLNMVGFTSTPTVKGTEETVIRGYTLGSDRSENITLSTQESAGQLCLFSNVKCKSYFDEHSYYSEAKVSSSNNNNVTARVGVFTAYAEKDARSGNATIIVHHKNAYVKPIVRTKTVSVGDRNVTLGVHDGNNGYLRWMKDGVLNSTWDNLKDILFDTITLADAGIYECFTDGTRQEGKHAFIQLIVRECPHNKWSPPHCNISCDVCYNGGVCDTHTGTCICPSGFNGTNCTIPTGGNHFGRDDGFQCQGKLFCPPIPQGCACYVGWKELDCQTNCQNGKYGADCLQDCHCDFKECDHSTGCEKNATCHFGYKGPRCLVTDYNETSSNRTTSTETTHATNTNGPTSDRTTSMKTTHATNTNGPTSDRTTSMKTTHVTGSNELLSDRTTSMETPHAINTKGPTIDRTTSMETTYVTNANAILSDRMTKLDTSYGNVYW